MKLEIYEREISDNGQVLKKIRQMLVSPLFRCNHYHASKSIDSETEVQTKENKNFPKKIWRSFMDVAFGPWF